MKDSTKLSAKQEKALAALLQHGSVRGAAGALGVSEVTVFRYLQGAEFQRQYRAARAQMVETALAMMQRLCEGAVHTLAAVMKDADAPASARVAAARTVLETSMKAVEMEELIERVERLEQVAEVKRNAFGRQDR